MPAKKNTSKSRVSNRAKKSGFKFHWWMGVIIVLIVAVVGIIVLRFSRASGPIAQVSCPGIHNSYVSEVSMTYNYPKYNSKSQKNVCMMSTSANWRWGDYSNSVRYNPGAAATYCVYGRYVGNVQFRIQARDASGREWPSAVSYLQAQDSNVKGFGSVWAADPAPGTSGGPTPLACARIQTSSGASQGIAYELLGGNGLVFLDNIQVTDIHN